MSAISTTMSTSVSSAVAELGQQVSRNVAQTLTPPATVLTNNTAGRVNTDTVIGDPEREFVRVSSSIGRAASAGQLSRQEALDIYRQIASLL